MNADFGSGVELCVISGKHGDSLAAFHVSITEVVGGESAREFIEAITDDMAVIEFQKVDVTRSISRLCRDKGRIGWLDAFVLAIELVEHQFVGAQVVDDEHVRSGNLTELVSMGFFLTFGVGLTGTFVGFKENLLVELAIAIDGVGDSAPAAIVGDEGEFAV